MHQDGNSLEDRIKAFLTPGYGDGDGSGSGYGYGDGSGSSSGSGSGSGSGYGSSSGSGSGSGSGYGSGYGDGSGSGSGYGYGDGSGSGSGYGDGSGSGSGYGDGDGSGYGDGSGSGSGDGDGDGSGYGSGRKVKQINNEPVYVIDDVPTVIRQCHGDVARGAILQDDLQLAPCYIVKVGGYWAHGETLEQAREALEEKILDDLPVEQKIEEFLEKFRTGTKYPAMDFYKWHHFLTGSCEMGRKQFAKNHGIDLEKDALTPEQFMILTMDDFGSSVIRQLMDEWSKKYPDAKVTSSPHPSR